MSILIKKMTDDAEIKGKAYNQVVVWELKDNGRAINFYEKCGFRLDGTEDVLILGTPVTEVRMIKKLGDEEYGIFNIK